MGATLAGQLCDGCFGEVPERLLPMLERPGGVARGWYLGSYSGPLGALMRLGKYGGNEAALRAIGRYIGARLPPLTAGLPVVPVPSTWQRVLVRGFDPVYLLTTAMGVSVTPLLRRREGPAQASRPREARAANARGRFSCPTPLSGPALLVDDVVTTGATAATCADALLQAGATEVLLLTVCMGRVQKT